MTAVQSVVPCVPPSAMSAWTSPLLDQVADDLGRAGGHHRAGLLAVGMLAQRVERHRRRPPRLLGWKCRRASRLADQPGIDDQRPMPARLDEIADIGDFRRLWCRASPESRWFSSWHDPLRKDCDLAACAFEDESKIFPVEKSIALPIELSLGGFAWRDPSTKTGATRSPASSAKAASSGTRSCRSRFGVSTVTIRQDIDALSARGVAAAHLWRRDVRTRRRARTPASIFARPSTGPQSAASARQRRPRSVPARRSCWTPAQRRSRSRDSLPENADITVVTCALNIALEAGAKSGVTVIVCGGRLNPRTLSTADSETGKQLSRFSPTGCSSPPTASTPKRASPSAAPTSPRPSGR